MTLGERVFLLLIRVYPRAFREQFTPDLLAFFREDRVHPGYGSGPLRPLRFWMSTLRDLLRVAFTERMGRNDTMTFAVIPEIRRSPVLVRWISALQFDIRHAVRSLRSTPAVTLTALLVLTLGIGASTAIFSVVDGIVLRGLPFKNESRLVAINETDLATGRPVSAAYQNYAEWTARQDVFEEIAGSAAGGAFITAGQDRPERLRVHRITPNLLGLLGAAPALGAGFRTNAPTSNPRVALISDSVWRRRFNADPGVVGRTMAFDSGTYEIAGVMPRGFIYPIGSALVSDVDIWIPYVPEARDLIRTQGRNYFMRVVGRLEPGVSLEAAAARMTQIRDSLAAEHPKWFADRGITVRPIKESIVPAQVRSWMLMLLAAVGGVFFVACANVANLLLARASGRSRDIGVRAAMGATRWQLVRGMVIESIVLSLAGTAAGLLMAFWAIDVLRATLPDNLPRVSAIAVDLRVVGVGALLALATGILCGFLPAVQMSRTDVSAALRSSTRSATAGSARQRARTAFLVVEVALAAVLLVGAGVFVSSFIRIVNTDLGFESARLLTVSVSPKLPPGDAGRQAARARAESMLLEVLAQVRAVPGIESAALVAGGVPLSGSWSTQPVQVPGRASTSAEEVVVKQVTGDYLVTVGATLLRGRSVLDSDVSGSPLVVVLSDEAARKYFGPRDPLGSTISLDGEAPRTVVGIVSGMRLLGPEAQVQPEAYVPYRQSANHNVSASLVIKTANNPAAALPAVKAAIWTRMPDVVIPDPKTFDEMYAALVAQRKLNMILLALFGGLALLIASIGIYGVMAYLVEQRTREIGVRMALGALPARILGMILSRASAAIAGGLAIGFLGVAWLERFLMAFVFQGVPHDPLVYGGAATLLISLGLLAAYVPARRAAHVDPLAALRTE